MFWAQSHDNPILDFEDILVYKWFLTGYIFATFSQLWLFQLDQGEYNRNWRRSKVLFLKIDFLELCNHFSDTEIKKFCNFD